jgi:hypothetical protein
MMWWFLGPLTLLPLAGGQGIDWSYTNAASLFGALVGHILYGLIVGLVCAVKRRWFTAGKVPPGNWFAPPGSNRSSGGGNETTEASDVKGRF